MLSLKEGVKIARIIGGKHDKKFIRLREDDGKIDNGILLENPIDFLNKNFFKGKGLTFKQIKEIKKKLISKKKPNDPDLFDIYREALENIIQNKNKQIFIKDGKVQPLPRKNIVEKILVTGKSGCGKSTFVSKWLKEARKMFKLADDDIIIISKLDEDPILDKLNPLRIDLDEDMMNDPLQVSELANSVVVMDDIEKIRNKYILNNVLHLRDEILEVGRHFNTRLLCATHLLFDYKNTRVLLNEATAICLFCHAGSTFHIRRLLKEFIGLDKIQIQKLIKLKSRWVCIYTESPMYVLHEHGAYLLT